MELFFEYPIHLYRRAALAGESLTRPRSPGRRKTREKLDRAENVYPEGVPPERCQFDRARLAWRIENGRAVLVCYRLHQAPCSEQLARVPDLLPRSDYRLEMAIILAFLVYTIAHVRICWESYVRLFVLAPMAGSGPVAPEPAPRRRDWPV